MLTTIVLIGLCLASFGALYLAMLSIPRCPECQTRYIEPTGRETWHCRQCDHCWTGPPATEG